MNLVWSRQARLDLQAIRDYIERDSAHYARLLVRRLIERVEHVVRMPTLGHPVHEFPGLGLRETHQDNYRIIYDFTEAELEVITIVHMKQQLRRRRLSR